MQYFDDMYDNKHGFNDGDSVPEGCTLFRDVYIKAVNKLAKQKGSAAHLYAFDRDGVHNPYLILASGEDEAMEEAIDDARELDLDQYVDVVATINRTRFDEFLAR
jgi:hypothetical protein